MNNKERLISLLGFEPPINAADGALLDFGIVGTDAYSSSNKNTVKKAAIEVMKVILTTADTTNGQTGFSARYDRRAISKRIAELEDELYLSGNRIIRGIQPW